MPAWWRRVTLRCNYRVLRDSRLRALDDDSSTNPNSDLNGAFYYNSSYLGFDVPGDWGETVRESVYGDDDRTPHIDPPIVPAPPPTLYTLESGSKATLYIRGRSIWRSPEVYVGNQCADSVEVANDMQGLYATFEKLAMPPDKGNVDLRVDTSFGFDVLTKAVKIVEPDSTSAGALTASLHSKFISPDDPLVLDFASKVYPLTENISKLQVTLKNANATTDAPVTITNPSPLLSTDGTQIQLSFKVPSSQPSLGKSLPNWWTDSASKVLVELSIPKPPSSGSSSAKADTSATTVDSSAASKPQTISITGSDTVVHFVDSEQEKLVIYPSTLSNTGNLITPPQFNLKTASACPPDLFESAYSDLYASSTDLKIELSPKDQSSIVIPVNVAADKASGNITFSVDTAPLLQAIKTAGNAQTITIIKATLSSNTTANLPGIYFDAKTPLPTIQIQPAH